MSLNLLTIALTTPAVMLVKILSSIIYLVVVVSLILKLFMTPPLKPLLSSVKPPVIAMMLLIPKTNYYWMMLVILSLLMHFPTLSLTLMTLSLFISVSNLLLMKMMRPIPIFLTTSLPLLNSNSVLCFSLVMLMSIQLLCLNLKTRLL